MRLVFPHECKSSRALLAPLAPLILLALLPALSMFALPGSRAPLVLVACCHCAFRACARTDVVRSIGSLVFDLPNSREVR